MFRLTIFVAVLIPLQLAAQNRDAIALAVVEKKASQVGFYSSAGERIAGVAVGETPHEMVLDPDGQHLYVSDNGVLWMDYEGPGGNTISIVDIKARKKAGVISTGEFHRPHGLSLDPTGRRLLSTSENPDSLVLIDLETRKVVRPIDNGGKAPHMVMFSKDGKWAFASNTNSDNIGAVELKTGKLELIKGCKRPQGGALSADGSRYFVTCADSAEIHAIDTGSRKVVGKIKTGKGVNRVAFTPDESQLVYSIGDEGKHVGIADVATLKEVARVELGGHPLSCSVSKDGKYAFAGVQDNDEIYIVSIERQEVSMIIKTPEGAGPDPIMEIGRFAGPPLE